MNTLIGFRKERGKSRKKRKDRSVQEGKGKKRPTEVMGVNTENFEGRGGVH